ncbi:hypothetical protein QTG54_010977 [Skeletonema marinoi]|uniref:Uncharacterized protein n=1 Tax=Skeletonema marinoi TaxID=267567 RepID=A0AAD8Y2G3_9STRA|nr:hypothetical protein QTG54_010977 [Skeletonema marinoi]
MMQPVKILRSVLSIQSTLFKYHPLLIEGHSSDTRDPSTVANQITNNLKRSWNKRNITKPIILITQGDPLTERGISAITRIVANNLGIKRCLVCLDGHIDPEHAILADRHDVLYELTYSQLVQILNDTSFDGSPSSNEETLEEAVDNTIERKNARRAALGQDPLADWYKKYALLQEVTKSAFKQISGEVTVAHATDEIMEFSVTSFYEVGLELGFIDAQDMVNYSTDN